MRTFDAADGNLSADQLTLRRTNLGLVLRRLRDHGPRSRAKLATELGMTRSAVSTLVGDLAERGLVRTGDLERGAVGRPGTSVELDGHAVAGLGAEVNVNHVSTMALDLSGRGGERAQARPRRSRGPGRGGARPARRAGPGDGRRPRRTATSSRSA